MSPQVCLLPGAIAELFADVTHSGGMTVADRYGLMAAVLHENLSEEEKQAIDRMLRAVRKGRLTVVDSVSTIL